MLQANTGTP